jgi:hypothetical protein
MPKIIGFIFGCIHLLKECFGFQWSIFDIRDNVFEFFPAISWIEHLGSFYDSAIMLSIHL